ncbi:MAG TPA: hypothetical protein VGM98_10865, partial [Schlesneria sp.]
EIFERSREPWTEEEVQLLAKLYFEPKCKGWLNKITIELGRSPSAITSEISRQGMAKRGAKLRKCLGVGCYGN